MITHIPDLQSRGLYSPEELSTMQRIYISVCSNHQIAATNTAARHAIALAILREFDFGNHDVDAMKAAAILAAKAMAR